MASRRMGQLLGLDDDGRGLSFRKIRTPRGGPGRLSLELLENRTLLTVNPGTITGTGTMLGGQDAFGVNVNAAVVGGVASFGGSLTYSDAKARDSFVATSISSVQINEVGTTASGPTTSNGYFTITGTAKLNGSPGYTFEASGSLPFPANPGSTGGLLFNASGPNGASVYSTPWKPWDPGETVAISVSAPVRAATTTSVVASPNPSTFGQLVTFTATVGPTGVSGGYVAFSVDSHTPVNEPLINGQAVFKTYSLGVGMHSMVANYLGTSINAPSQGSTTQIVNQDATTTTLQYSGSLAPGAPLSLYATVAAQPPGYGKPTGSVTFYDGSTSLGMVTLSSSATALLHLNSGLSAGPHAITAVYSGDTNYVTSTSAVLSRTVAQLSTTTYLATSINPVVVGSTVNLTATVYGAGSNTTGSARPTGSVNFYDGGSFIGTAPLVSGVATLPTSFATAGYHALTAVYGGDTNFLTSTSNALTQGVHGTATAGHVVVTASSSSTLLGQPVTFTVSVTGGATGSVTLLDGSQSIGMAVLNRGSATFNISSLKAGTHYISATYSGDSNFTNATSSTIYESITLPTPGTITGSGTTLKGQDSLNLNVAATVTNYVPSYLGTLVYSDSKAGDTFTAVSITSVQIYESTPVTGPSSTNGYYVVTGTATLNGGTTLYTFKATASLPFPANAGSTGGMLFSATDPSGNTVYSTSWSPWDPGESMVMTA